MQIIHRYAARKYTGFSPNFQTGSNSPTIVLRKDPEHEATKEVYRDWLRDRTGKPVAGHVNWSTVTYDEIYALSERMFDAAGVPKPARETYYQAFEAYIATGKEPANLWTWEP